MKVLAVVFLAVSLTGCATWSTSSVDGKPADASTTQSQTSPKTLPASIVITDKDIVDRKYLSLGDITATVNKTTIFNANPTQEMVNEKLREKASELGADAVILVRYGDGGISLMSWGSLEGKGRAVKFSK